MHLFPFQDELERFPLSHVHEPTAVLKNDRRETYNNLVLFTVLDDPKRKNSPSDMHIFQSVNAPVSKSCNFTKYKRSMQIRTKSITWKLIREKMTFHAKIYVPCWIKMYFSFLMEFMYIFEEKCFSKVCKWFNFIPESIFITQTAQSVVLMVIWVLYCYIWW